MKADNTTQCRSFLTTHGRLAAFGVSLLTFVVYIPGLWNGFVNWDDHLYVYENLRIRALDSGLVRYAFAHIHDSGNWHPLTTLSHALDYALWGLRPSGHHLSSMVIHCLNTYIAFSLISRLYGEANRDTVTLAPEKAAAVQRMATIIAMVTGLLFGIHPIHVESVAWISERKDVLYALFYLLSIRVYVDYAVGEGVTARGQRIARYLGTIALFILSLLSKPMAVTLPLILLLLDWYPLGRFGKSGDTLKLLIEKIPLIALALCVTVVTVASQQSGGAVSSLSVVPLAARLAIAIKSLASYLLMVAWPTGLIPYYPYPANAKSVSLLSAGYLLPSALILCISALCIVMLRKTRLWAALWAYYVVSLLPVIGIVQVGSQEMADRYMYLPALAPFLAAGIGLAVAAEKVMTALRGKAGGKALLLIASVLAVTPLVFLTVKQIGIWRDGVTLWSKIIQTKPSSPKAYANRGEALAAEGHYEAAVEDYTRAISVALRTFDDSIAVYYHARGNLYLKLGSNQKALEDYGQAIWMSTSPNPDSYNSRGNIYLGLGRYQEAIQDYSEAIRLRPSDGGFYYNRAHVYEELGLLRESYADITEAIRLNPDPSYLRLQQELLGRIAATGGTKSE